MAKFVLVYFSSDSIEGDVLNLMNNELTSLKEKGANLLACSCSRRIFKKNIAHFNPELFYNRTYIPLANFLEGDWGFSEYLIVKAKRMESLFANFRDLLEHEVTSGQIQPTQSAA